MFKMTKVDDVPKKINGKTKSSEIIGLFEDFIQSEMKVVLVETDRKYANTKSFVNVLNASKTRYGYHSIIVMTRRGKVYLIRNDM